MMVHHYEINVALHGVHYFATHERSIRTERVANTILRDFRRRFPESDGFTVTCAVVEIINHRFEGLSE